MLSFATIPKPSNVAAEKALIGAIVRNNDLLDLIEGQVSSKDFFDPECREIFALIEEDNRAAKAFDEHLLVSRLAIPERLRLRECLDQAGQASVVIQHAKAIADLSARRELMSLGFDLLTTSTNENLDTDEIAESVENRIDQIRQGAKPSDEAENIGIVAQRICERGADLWQEGKQVGIRSGIFNLDAIMLPLRPKNFVIIAGRPSQGKTALALNILENVAVACAKGASWACPVAMFSYEMSKEEAIERVLSKYADIPSSDIANGNFCAESEQYLKLVRYSEYLQTVPFYIETPEKLTANNLYAKCKKLVRKYGVKLIIIDYLQLMDGDEKAQSHDRISRISKACKRAASRLDIVIVGLSQLSRAIESREDKTPLLSDLRESGSLEQDADLIIFCYREEYYLALSEPSMSDTRWNEWYNKMEAARGNATLIVGKQRRGQQGRVNVKFCGRRTWFY